MLVRGTDKELITMGRNDQAEATRPHDTQPVSPATAAGPLARAP
jgi:hypothetical protein